METVVLSSVSTVTSCAFFLPPEVTASEPFFSSPLKLVTCPRRPFLPLAAIVGLTKLRPSTKANRLIHTFMLIAPRGRVLRPGRPRTPADNPLPLPPRVMHPGGGPVINGNVSP